MSNREEKVRLCLRIAAGRIVVCADEPVGLLRLIDRAGIIRVSVCGALRGFYESKIHRDSAVIEPCLITCGIDPMQCHCSTSFNA